MVYVHASGNVIDGFDYTYNAAGQVTSETDDPYVGAGTGSTTSSTGTALTVAATAASLTTAYTYSSFAATRGRIRCPRIRCRESGANPVSVHLFRGPYSTFRRRGRVTQSRPSLDDPFLGADGLSG